MSLVARTDFSMVLQLTLNVWERENSLLDDGRQLLRDDLYLSDKVEQLAEELLFEIRIRATPDQLANVLNLLTYERRGAVRDRISQEILEPLPRAQAALSDTASIGLGGPELRFDRLVRAVLIAVWPEDRIPDTFTTTALLYKLNIS